MLGVLESQIRRVRISISDLHITRRKVLAACTKYLVLLTLLLWIYIFLSDAWRRDFLFWTALASAGPLMYTSTFEESSISCAENLKEYGWFDDY